MARILYLVHRLPYPPNKGDKLRSYHLLKHLGAHHKVWLATFVDDPDNLERTWAELKVVMAPGALDPLVKDLIYVAISANNSCTYCVRSHTASSRAKGATDEMLAELHAVVAAANRTNRLAIGLQVPVDEVFA